MVGIVLNSNHLLYVWHCEVLEPLALGTVMNSNHWLYVWHCDEIEVPERFAIGVVKYSNHFPNGCLVDALWMLYSLQL